MRRKTALVTGITGQDGSYLAEFLAGKGYRVCGLVRPERKEAAPRLEAVRDRVELFPADMLDEFALIELLRQVQPDEVYNLAATTFVPACWDRPAQAIEFSTVSVTRLLDAIRRVCPAAHFFQAGSSEMFGNAAEAPQRETTPFHPRSPYGAAKVSAHYITTAYREAYGLFACSGILFNHESPRRGLEFVTRKITHAVARIKLGLAGELRLGNLQAKRDWGYAGDYVRAMWLMLQQAAADDYVIGTGETHSVEEFVAVAFDHVGLDWHDHVVVDPQFYRPAEVDLLLADPTKARQRLNWEPEVSFPQLVRMMVDSDLAQLRGQDPARAGLERAA
jgi:GDPmannose 4,6-dehydratase